MSSLEATALVIATAWMGILTILMLVIIRQVGVLTLRLDNGGVGSVGDEFVPNDGLPIGSDVPAEVQEAIPESAIHSAFLVLISATCNPCREFATELNRHGFNRDENVVVFLTGRENLATPLAKLMPPTVRVIRDPHATALAHSLDLQVVPSALAIESGKVTGSAHLRQLSDLYNLLDGYHRGEPVEMDAHEVERVVQVG